MGNHVSKVVKTTNQTINKTAQINPIVKTSKSSKPIDSKDVGEDIARNMHKLNLHATMTETKSLYNKESKIGIPDIDKISIDTCKLLFKDAKKLRESELASKYRLKVEFVRKLVTSYEWPDNQVIVKTSTTSFGRTDVK